MISAVLAPTILPVLIGTILLFHILPSKFKINIALLFRLNRRVPNYIEGLKNCYDRRWKFLLKPNTITSCAY